MLLVVSPHSTALSAAYTGDVKPHFTSRGPHSTALSAAWTGDVEPHVSCAEPQLSQPSVQHAQYRRCGAPCYLW